MSQNNESLKQIGAEEMILCDSIWSSVEWLAWGVKKFPDIEAIQKHEEYLFSINWFEYIESKTYSDGEIIARYHILSDR